MILINHQTPLIGWIDIDKTVGHSGKMECEENIDQSEQC